MQMMSRTRNAGSGWMAAEEKARHAGAGSEASLADGTGEGNAPIEGSSASADPEILAGATKEESATSLNDDDYPANIAEAAGAADDGTDDGDGDAGASAGNENDTSGQTRMPDQAAGVDLDNGSARPDGKEKG